MAWDLNSDRPIYAQIVEKVTLDILSGRYQPGDRLPSVRELAQEAAVNPNTMQKALSELERTGLVDTHRTAGRYITEDRELIDLEKQKLAKEKIEDFLNSMAQIGLSRVNVIEMVERIAKKQMEGNA